MPGGGAGGGCGLAISVDGSTKGGALSSRFQFKEAATMLAQEEEEEERRRRTGSNMQHKARPL